MRIRDYLEWQDDTNLDAFITRLTEPDPDRVRESIRQYVVSDKVRDRLDAMLKAVGGRLDDGRDVGRYVHGPFGSGKSNLLTVLGKMLERDEVVYDLGHAALRELRAKHGWLDRHRTLVEGLR
jgi:predicted ATPase